MHSRPTYLHEQHLFIKNSITLFMGGYNNADFVP